MTLRSFIATSFLILTGFSSDNAFGLTLAQFKDCIYANVGAYGSTCSLDAGTYNIASGSDTIVIGRSNITVQGNTSSPASYVIKRSNSSSAYALMQLTASPALTNVTIQGLTFDGNVANNGSLFVTDLDLQVNTAHQYIGIQYCVFKNARDAAIQIASYETFIAHNTFDNPGIIAQTAASSTVNGLHVEDNYFDLHPGSAIAITKTSYVTIADNTFNVAYSSPWGVYPSGILFLNTDTTTVYVTTNTFNGANLSGPSGQYMVGVEGYGTYHYLDGNNIYSFSGSGIDYAGGSNLSLGLDASSNGNWLHSNASAGATFRNDGLIAQCTSNLSITGLVSDSNAEWGLHVWKYSGSCGSITGVSVTNGYFCNNGLASASHGVGFDGTVSSPTTSGNTCQ